MGRCVDPAEALQAREIMVTRQIFAGDDRGGADFLAPVSELFAPGHRMIGIRGGKTVARVGEMRVLIGLEDGASRRPAH